MADNRDHIGEPERSRVSGSGDYELNHLAQKHGMSRDEVRKMVEQHGNDRDTLERVIAVRREH